MKHFLVTRFNLSVKGWETSKSGNQVLTEAWLKNRFYLFKNYCLPSVKQQTNQNFYWCVFFDVKTPKKYNDYIENISKSYENLIPFYVNGNEYFLEEFTNFISQNIKKNDDYVITTRLDNDDLIHKDFIKTIQEIGLNNKNTVIDIRTGFSITLKKNFSEIRKYNNPFNPFISLVEKADKIQTVLSKMHHDWKDVKNLTIYEGSRLWIELVHEENKLNATKKGLRRINKINNKDFGVKKPFLFKENRLQLWFANLSLSLNHFMKALKSIIKKNKY